jgi:hypothetical protein
MLRKTAKFQKPIFWWVPTCQTKIFWSPKKYLNFGSQLFSRPYTKVPKKVWHTPVRQKLNEEIYFLEACCIWPRAVH